MVIFVWDYDVESVYTIELLEHMLPMPEVFDSAEHMWRVFNVECGETAFGYVVRMGQGNIVK